MENNEIECLTDENGSKYYVLKNSSLDLSDKSIMIYSKNFKELNNNFYYKGKLIHREDGPAIVWDVGHNQYYINGKEISETEYKKYLIEKEYKEFSNEIKKNIINKNKMKV